jgi:hypothetical protein
LLKQSAKINKHGGKRANSGGRRSGAGRKKGSPNKLTADVKAGFMAAFDEVGGADYLKTVAQTDPRTFCTLLARYCRLRSPVMPRVGPSASNSHGCRRNPASRNPL